MEECLVFVSLLAFGAEAAPSDLNGHTSAFNDRMFEFTASVVPAFFGGAIGGLVLWCTFLFLYKAGGYIFKKTVWHQSTDPVQQPSPPQEIVERAKTPNSLAFERRGM